VEEDDAGTRPPQHAELRREPDRTLTRSPTLACRAPAQSAEFNLNPPGETAMLFLSLIPFFIDIPWIF
jgi:hypothetical protein